MRLYAGNLTTAETLGAREIAYNLIDKYGKDIPIAKIQAYLESLGNTSQALADNVQCTLKALDIVFIDENDDIVYSY